MPSRLFVSLLLFCHALVSVVLPFQHHHSLVSDREGLPITAVRLVGAASAPLHTRLAVAPAAHPLDRCLACEWQSAQVSPALPLLRLKFVVSPAPRVPTTLPRYLSIRVISTSSRAPPTV